MDPLKNPSSDILWMRPYAFLQVCIRSCCIVIQHWYYSIIAKACSSNVKNDYLPHRPSYRSSCTLSLKIDSTVQLCMFNEEARVFPFPLEMDRNINIAIMTDRVTGCAKNEHLSGRWDIKESVRQKISPFWPSNVHFVGVAVFLFLCWIGASTDFVICEYLYHLRSGLEI